MLVRDARCLLGLVLICAQGLVALVAATSVAQPSPEPRARILFLLPGVEAGMRSQLREALEAQLALVDAELRIADEDAEMRQQPLAERIEAARALAERDQAGVVLWLEPGREGVWLLHVLDIGQDRMVVRRIDAAQPGAAFEAIAVLTREASRGGDTENVAPQDPDDSEPAPAPTPAPSPSPEADLPLSPNAPVTGPTSPTVRLALLYSGVDFAPGAAFNHGVVLSARLGWPAGQFVGVSAGWTALIEPEGPLVLRRIPLGAATGIRLEVMRRGWVDIELGLVVELLHRTTRPNSPDQVPEADRLRVAAGLAPRLRAEYKPLDVIGIFAGFGIDLMLTKVPYELGGTARQTVLSPNTVRPGLEAGVAFYP